MLQRLIAVSKFIPSDLVKEAHDAGQVDFGENYVQELLEKSATLPQTIRWHFIGRLQSNKVKKLLDVPNLVSIETVDSAALAERTPPTALVASGRVEQVLDLSIQVDTSNEATKGGVSPDAALPLAEHVAALSPHVRLAGLMTIGAPGDLSAFERLHQLRHRIAQQLQAHRCQTKRCNKTTLICHEKIRHLITSGCRRKYELLA
eukprot:g2896.t1